jgi:MOSC domain-containing protein YiiM/ribosomal protein S18 acetylase RimI-like enzyme
MSVTLSAAGRVLQVNRSPGGVPKEPVPEARIGVLGLDGDRHRANTVHGGPIRAVCLLGIEVIERLEAEGHPIFPGSVGENLTTSGIELADLPAGTRLAVGNDVVLEVTAPAMPCDTIVRSFRDGKSGRISILLHPHDSRMYARVLREGVVRPHDAIRVLPPEPTSDVATQVALFRLESVVRYAQLALWRAAEAAGHQIAIVESGELAVGSSPDLPGPPFNQALGLRPLPIYLPLVLERFSDTGQPGWLAFPTAPWPGASPDFELATFTAEPVRIDRAYAADGVEIREVEPGELDAWADGPMGRRSDPAVADAWPRILRRLGRSHNHYPFAAVEDGRVVATALLVTHRRTGLLTATTVAAGARGRGLQRALIAARVERAVQLGCELIAVETATDNAPSLRNLHRAGFEELSRRTVYRFDPVTDGEAAIAAARATIGAWEPARLPGPTVVARPG